MKYSKGKTAQYVTDSSNITNMYSIIHLTFEERGLASAVYQSVPGNNAAISTKQHNHVPLSVMQKEEILDLVIDSPLYFQYTNP